jgi:hypothetical protein
MAKTKDIRMQDLLGTIVKDVNGESVGRIEEIAATMHDGDLLVDGYIVGRYGLASRMSFGSSLHWLARILGMNVERGHIIPWDKLDLSSPLHPVTTCAKEELKKRPR